MGEYSEKSTDSTGQHTIVAKKSDTGSTRTFHGEGGAKGAHTTEHSDGSWWSTGSSGKATKTSDSGSGSGNSGK